MVAQVKVDIVEQAKERLARSQAVVVVDYQGLTVAEVSDLRQKLRDAGGEMKVIKNRLTKRALAEAQYDALDEILNGPTALAFGYDDPVGPAKVCMNYAKDNEKLEVLGGLLEGRRVDLDKIKALAKLPGREELLTQMAGTMKAPMRQMATAMHQAVAKVAYAMKARADQLEDAA